MESDWRSLWRHSERTGQAGSYKSCQIKTLNSILRFNGKPLKGQVSELTGLYFQYYSTWTVVNGWERNAKGCGETGSKYTAVVQERGGIRTRREGWQWGGRERARHKTYRHQLEKRDSDREWLEMALEAWWTSGGELYVGHGDSEVARRFWDKGRTMC